MIKKTLYFGNPYYLSKRNAQLVLQEPKDEKKGSEATARDTERTIPIEDIGVVVLDNQRITFTSGLMEALLDNNCAVITCDSRHMPVGLLLPLYGNTTQTERFRNQIDASQPLKKQLWQQTVRQKILNQASVLNRNTGCVVKNMQVWANDVKSGDPENLEGRAAAFYWKNLFPEKADFTRGREGTKQPA